MVNFSNPAMGIEFIPFLYQFAVGPKYNETFGKTIEYTYNQNSIDINNTIEPKVLKEIDYNLKIWNNPDFLN